MQDVIKPDRHANTFHDPNEDPHETERKFFSQIPKTLIRQLYEEVYKVDFDMLGYEYPSDYIEMGL